MAFRHGRFAEIKVASNDLSDYCDSADINISVDTAETTTFGKDWKTYIAGLAGATLSLKGNYDPTTSTGPAAVLMGLIGDDDVAIELFPGGNVSGQRKHAFDAILTGYTEASAVADKVTFTANLIVTDEVTTTTVGA